MAATFKYFGSHIAELIWSVGSSSTGTWFRPSETADLADVAANIPSLIYDAPLTIVTSPRPGKSNALFVR